MALWISAIARSMSSSVTSSEIGAPVERPPADAAFDDDEIEKAIAEIRGAIEKSSRILK